MNAREIKERAKNLGADICGIAPVSRFSGAPAGFHPRDIFPECESVVIFGVRFPLFSVRAASTVPYTLTRNSLVTTVDEISVGLCCDLESCDVVSVPVPSSDPYEHWDDQRSHGRGILSLKHAGQLAGLGIIGKNTLLINDTYGNMLWLGGALVAAVLDPDPAASYKVCPSGCTLCLDGCPGGALNGTTIDQKRCREHAYTHSEGGGWLISCFACRTACPNHAGLKRASE